MISRRRFALSLSAFALSPLSAHVHAAVRKTPTPLLPPLPPLAREEAVTDNLWGKNIVDPYRWMEQKPDTAEFTNYLKAQGGFARQVLDKLPGRRAIEASLQRFSAATTTLAIRQVTTTQLIFARRSPDQQVLKIYAIAHAGGAERLLIDPEAGNKGGQGGQPRRVTEVLMSPDNKHLAYAIDKGGDEMHELHVLTLDSGKDVLITRLNGMPASWLPDSSGLFYARLRDGAVKGKVDFSFDTATWLHKMDKDPAQDTLAFRWSDGPAMGQTEREMPVVHVNTASDWALGAIYSNGEWPAYGMVARLNDLLAGKPGWAEVFRKDDIATHALTVGDDVYVLAKGKSERGEVFKVSLREADKGKRVVVVPQGDYVIDSLSLAKDGLYIHELRGQVGALRRYGFATGKVEDVKLPLTGAVWNIQCHPAIEGAWFGMDDLTWSARTLQTGPNLVAKDTGLTPKAAFDTSSFLTTRQDIKARDGTAVPVEILHKNNTKLNGKNPLLIIAYGAYGIILDPGFQGSMLAFLDQGGVIVYAHVRGGGEKGETWHTAGQKASKPNTWRDVIDVAEAMIKDGWTARGKLAVWGTSAGGIMVGRAITERPDLFAVAIGEVGVFNTLRFELTSNGPGNDEEFGTVKKEDEFRALLEMDAYHHVKPETSYPATLLMTGANDLRVEPWQIAKMAARMQKNYDPKRPVLMRVDYDSGHYSTTKKSGIAKHLDMFSFILGHTRG
ncbi:prolyl oligopeptidase family serine peptidase [Undibacterium sp. Ji83W]|uniref:prolyl oligopeptidase family serine peptidase n=1 Tax=Undibacterium sp. Ji83W TaxID=3413043 RepID=UPI003BF243E0